MLEIRNHETWAKVIANAIAKASDNPGNRKVENWVKQIGYAAKSIETNPYLHFEENKLIVLSERSLNIYEVDEYCDCIGAVEYGQTCWHRVAKRLWENYLEADAMEADAILETEFLEAIETPEEKSKRERREQQNAPYLKSSSENKPEKVGNIRI